MEPTPLERRYGCTRDNDKNVIGKSFFVLLIYAMFRKERVIVESLLYRIKELSTDYSSTKFLERFCKTRAVMKGGRGEDELRHELITLHDNKEAERGPDF